MKKTIQSNNMYVSLMAITLVLAILVAFLLVKTHILNNRLNETQATSEMQIGRLQAAIGNQKTMQRPVIIADKQLVVFPELKAALPYNNVTKHLQYYVDDQANLRVTSALLNDYAERQLSCDELVRVGAVAKPLSPWESAVGSVTLAEGRTLSIVAAKAFKNNQASTLECETEVWTQVSPSQVADEFKKAQAY